jgi:hypothetical protein
VHNIALACLNKFVEPILSRWPFNKLRKRALSSLMDHIHYEDENSNYIGLCPINKVICKKKCHLVRNPLCSFFTIETRRGHISHLVTIYSRYTFLEKRLGEV